MRPAACLFLALLLPGCAPAVAAGPGSAPAVAPSPAPAAGAPTPKEAVALAAIIDLAEGAGFSDF